MARTLAETLAYRLVDDELPRLIGARLGMPADVVESMENRVPGFGERLLAGLSGAVPEVAGPVAAESDDLLSAYRREVGRLMQEAAADASVVILGRYGNAVLADRPNLVRVFLQAPLPWRIINVRASLNCDVETARAEIVRIDEASRRLGRELYRMAWGELRNYDLVLDTSRFGAAESAGIIASAVRAAQAEG